MTPLQPPPNSTVDLTNGDAVQPEWRRWFLIIRNIINGFPGNLPATATNDNAAAGNVGEYLSVDTGGLTALTSLTAANVASISLTAGDWDVSGTVTTAPSGTTQQAYVQVGLSTVSATMPAAPTGGRLVTSGCQTFAGISIAQPIGPGRFSLAATTTVYLVVNCNYSPGTLSASGLIRARRVR